MSFRWINVIVMLCYPYPVEEPEEPDTSVTKAQLSNDVQALHPQEAP